MADDLTLGQWLAKARQAKGLTLRDVERLTEGRISNAAVSQIESGHIERPAASKLHMLAKTYGLDFGETLERAGRIEDTVEAKRCPTCGSPTPGPHP